MDRKVGTVYWLSKRGRYIKPPRYRLVKVVLQNSERRHREANNYSVVIWTELCRSFRVKVSQSTISRAHNTVLYGRQAHKRRHCSNGCPMLCSIGFVIQ